MDVLLHSSIVTQVKRIEEQAVAQLLHRLEIVSKNKMLVQV
jgi:hypothetical protein